MLHSKASDCKLSLDGGQIRPLWNTVLGLTLIGGSLLLAASANGSEEREGAITLSSGSNSEPDGTIVQGTPQVSETITLGEGTNVPATVVLAQQSKMILFPTIIGEFKVICPDGELRPLFRPAGRVDKTLLLGERAKLCVQVIEVERVPRLNKELKTRLDDLPMLQGRTWGQPRIKSEVITSLVYQDPRNKNSLHRLADCSLHRVEGKALHKLYFLLEGHALDMLRDADREELSLSFGLSAFSKCTTQMLHAEAASISTAWATVLNDLKSSSGAAPDYVISATRGAAVDSESALRNFFQQRMIFAIGLRQGQNVPTEVLNGVMDRLMSGAFQQIDLQHQSQDKLISVLVSNQLLAPAFVGKINSSLQSARNALESASTDDISTGKSSSMGGGISIGGFGVNASVASADQRHELKQRLLKSLDEATAQFSGDLTALSSITALHVNRLSNVQSSALDLEIAKFDLRYQPIELNVALTLNCEHAERLAKLRGMRSELQAKIEVARKELGDMAAQSAQAVFDLSHLSGDLRSQFATARNMQETIGLFDGFRRWEIHTHKGDGWYVFYLNGEHNQTQTRRQFLQSANDSHEVAVRDFEIGVAKFEQFTSDVAADAAARKAVSDKLSEMQSELSAIQREIESLLEAGIR